MNILIREVSKEDLGYFFGRAHPERGEVWVRKDLPKWVKMSIVVHEIYHMTDTATNVKWREFKATVTQLFMPFLGGIWCILFSLLNKDRLRHYIDLFLRH